MSTSDLVWNDQKHSIQNEQLDQYHQEFIQLLNQCNQAEKSEFAAAFAQLLEHTQTHFEDEKRLMLESQFPSTAEHLGEHDRVLGELTQFNKRIQRGNSMMARAYVREKLPEWFELHTSTMDSALAAHIANT